MPRYITTVSLGWSRIEISHVGIGDRICVILLTSAVAATRFAILALGVDFNSLSLGPKATTVFLPS